MKLSRQILFATSISLAAIVVPRLATAAEHIIEMRNKDDAGNLMAFQPSFLKAEVGDTVKFVPTDKSHNAESVAEVWPEGAAPVKGSFSKEVSFTPEKEGIYVLKCTPHYGMGMVGAGRQARQPRQDQGIQGDRPREKTARCRSREGRAIGAAA